MKLFPIGICLLFMLASCKQTKQSSNENDVCFTGKLMIKGICGQRVISVQDASTAIKLNASWINPDKGDTLKNVFSVSNVCDFPDDIDTGDTFKFKIVSKEEEECMVCMAYTPIPEENNQIEICKN